MGAAGTRAAAIYCHWWAHGAAASLLAIINTIRVSNKLGKSSGAAGAHYLLRAVHGWDKIRPR
jgi:hypothetical protein